ncbi:ABC-F family ATP-binding cassette domain-containing protein [Desulfovibrio legallii]|uniref:ABC transporter ATP-binding protein n=1 Tax=Desulfovibrio legallii TaxID=571438 RepID=A0A6H3FDG0_9BACT|nr:ABC-F family ATP-binding cassette domain-containing protein [Desulfovibrio legallii]TBH80795.1 ABC transporter ATP-binding protein [Desulfovibrio legallii]CAI3239000.1 Bis-ABC ATPase YheS [Desulfovibrio diazotrophicus]
MKITIQELSKSFGGRDIFNNFSLEVDSGVRLCVCGPNGTGKSTLLRLLAGVESPDAGRVILPRGCRLGFVEQELSDAALDTPLLTFVLDVLHDWNDFWAQWEDAAARKDEALLAGLMQRQTELEAQYGYNPEHRAKAVLSGLGFSERKWGRTLRELSGGWRERAKLARVLTAGADVLLLDEPTNHLDVEAVEWLESFLLDFKGALVFVAHDRVFMDNVGSHVLYLGLSKPVFRKATYTQFLALQEEYNAQREREARALQDDLNRKMAFVERFRAKATKARQAGSRQKMAKKLEKQLEDYRPEPKRKELSFTWPEAPHLEKVALAAADLAFHFEDGRELWPALTFTLYRGQRVALVGPNGCGKSTLLRLLAGRLERCGGNVVTAPQLRLGFYTQHQMDTLRPDTTVLGEIRRLADPRTTEEELMSVLGLFLLGQEYFDRQVSALSGGEKSRLVLASLFLRRCNFLLLDEPTNHLDLESREALISALQKFDGTLLMVAHDRWLLSQVGAEAWELTRRGLDLYPDFTSYDTARRARLAQPLGAAKSGPAAASKAGPKAGPGEQPVSALSREEQKRLKREQAARRNALHKELKPLQERYAALEKDLAAVLEEQSAVEAQLADPQVYADHNRSNELLRAFDAHKQRSEQLLEEMTALEESLQETRVRWGEDNSAAE